MSARVIGLFSLGLSSILGCAAEVLGDGTSSSDAFVADTWQALVPASPPEARSSAASAFDRVQRVGVLFGGNEASADTYVWTSAQEWQRLQGTSSSVPSARFGHSLVAIPGITNTARFLLFGGRSTTDEGLNDLWRLDITVSGGVLMGSWTALQSDDDDASNSRPGGRFGHSATWLENAGKMLVYGGQGHGADDCSTSPWDGELLECDTWLLTLNRSGGFGSWKHVQHDENGPGGRARAATIYNPSTGRAYVFGGDSWSTGMDAYYSSLSDLWELDPNACTFWFLGRCWNRSPKWFRIHWSQEPRIVTPSIRGLASFAYSRARAESVLFGGRTIGRYAEERTPMDDTWTLRCGLSTSCTRGQCLSVCNWEELSPVIEPPARSGATILVDDTDRAILFGGHAGDLVYGDSWALIRTPGIDMEIASDVNDAAE